MSEINFEDTIINITLGDIIQQFNEADMQRKMPILMQDIDAETKELVDTYQAYISAGNFAEAATYRANNPALETRIWDAFKANSSAVFSLYTYLYAKSKGQQCIVSATQPPEASEDGSVIGQVEGDIWFRIDEEKDGVINTTPFQKQADGTYKEFTVAPKLTFSSNDDIDEICDESVEKLTNPNSIVHNDSLNYFEGKINTRINECFQYASNGKNLLIQTITGYGVEIESDATFSDINEGIVTYVDNMNQTVDSGKSKIISALKKKGVSISSSSSLDAIANAITNSGLYIPPNSLNGTFHCEVVAGSSYSKQITFSTPFGTTPTVICSAVTFQGYAANSVATNISRTGCTIVVTVNQTSGIPRVDVTWRAYTN